MEKLKRWLRRLPLRMKYAVAKWCWRGHSGAADEIDHAYHDELYRLHKAGL